MPINTKSLCVSKCHSTSLTPRWKGQYLVPRWSSLNNADFRRKATDQAFYYPTQAIVAFFMEVSWSISCTLSTPSTTPWPWWLLKAAQRQKHIRKGQEKWEIKTIPWVTSSPTQATSQCRGPQLIFYMTSERITSPPQHCPGGWSGNHN